MSKTIHHTEGPWHIAGYGKNIEVRGHANSNTGGGLVIARVLNTHDGNYENNAKLIKEVPAFFMALQDASDVLCDGTSTERMNVKWRIDSLLGGI